MRIEDGNGKGFVAKVNSQNRVLTFAESLPGGVIAATEKKLFTVATDLLEFTDDTESAIFYVRYTGANKLIMPRVAFTIEESTGAAGDSVVFMGYQNPTEGTIISDASAATIRNRNFSGTAGQFPGVGYQGGQGKTMTDGDTFARPVFAAGSELNILELESEPICLEGGNSIGYTVTPPAGNTSISIRMLLYFYELTLE